MWRTSFSALYTKKLSKNNSFWAASIIWGYNEHGGHHKDHSLLLENNLQLNNNTIYHRYEFIQKSPAELDLDPTLFTKSNYNIHAFTLGYCLRFLSIRHVDVVEGVQGTIYFPDKGLQSLYSRNPLAVEIYIHFRPSWHSQ
jgi:hypothetical protein